MISGHLRERALPLGKKDPVFRTGTTGLTYTDERFIVFSLFSPVKKAFAPLPSVTLAALQQKFDGCEFLIIDGWVENSPLDRPATSSTLP
jgi:hypothetical protein